MNVYDRLFRFGRKKGADYWVFDPDKIEGELAKSYSISPDNKVITITLRDDATWQDGSPVTAEDVKWSLDRAVSAKSLAAPQFTTGSLTSADQFKIVDPKTVTVTVEKPDRLALANLCVCYAIMINSKLAKKNATAEDPWAQEWMKANTARERRLHRGEPQGRREHGPAAQREMGRCARRHAAVLPLHHLQTVPRAARRAPTWSSAAMPTCPSISPPPTCRRSRSRRRRSWSRCRRRNGFTHLSMNTQRAVRQRQGAQGRRRGVALRRHVQGGDSVFGRGRKLYGASWSMPPDASLPQPIPNKTDPALAKKLLAEAGFPNGFSTTFAFNVGAAATAEPLAALLKESLSKVGIQVEIQKKPDAEFNTLASERKMPFFADGATAWLPYTYYFFYLYFTREQRWNFSSFKSTKMEELTLERALPDRQGQVRRRLPEDDRDLQRGNAADHALAAQPRRGHGEVGRRLHLSVLPPGRLPRPEDGCSGCVRRYRRDA